MRSYEKRYFCLLLLAGDHPPPCPSLDYKADTVCSEGDADFSAAGMAKAVAAWGGEVGIFKVWRGLHPLVGIIQWGLKEKLSHLHLHSEWPLSWSFDFLATLSKTPPLNRKEIRYRMLCDSNIMIYLPGLNHDLIEHHLEQNNEAILYLSNLIRICPWWHWRWFAHCSTPRTQHHAWHIVDTHGILLAWMQWNNCGDFQVCPTSPYHSEYCLPLLDISDIIAPSDKMYKTFFSRGLHACQRVEEDNYLFWT